MRKKIFIGLLAILMCFTLTACGSNNSNSKMSNDIIKIDGIYLNNEYTDNDGLKQIVLFYTLKAGEENIDISSSQFNLKINNNEYSAINDIETPNLTNNLEAVMEVIKFIYDNIMYAELNTKSDYCKECGFTGEILIDDNLEWYCPNCGNRDHNKLNVARRTCGYIGTNFWNKGRTQEIKERVIHIDNKDA